MIFDIGPFDKMPVQVQGGVWQKLANIKKYLTTTEIDDLLAYRDEAERCFKLVDTHQSELDSLQKVSHLLSPGGNKEDSVRKILNQPVPDDRPLFKDIYQKLALLAIYRYSLDTGQQKHKWEAKVSKISKADAESIPFPPSIKDSLFNKDLNRCAKYCQWIKLKATEELQPKLVPEKAMKLSVKNGKRHSKASLNFYKPSEASPRSNCTTRLSVTGAPAVAQVEKVAYQYLLLINQHPGAKKITAPEFTKGTLKEKLTYMMDNLAAVRTDAATPAEEKTKKKPTLPDIKSQTVSPQSNNVTETVIDENNNGVLPFENCPDAEQSINSKLYVVQTNPDTEKNAGGTADVAPPGLPEPAVKQCVLRRVADTNDDPHRPAIDSDKLAIEHTGTNRLAKRHRDCVCQTMPYGYVSTMSQTDERNTIDQSTNITPSLYKQVSHSRMSECSRTEIDDVFLPPMSSRETTLQMDPNLEQGPLIISNSDLIQHGILHRSTDGKMLKKKRKTHSAPTLQHVENVETISDLSQTFPIRPQPKRNMVSRGVSRCSLLSRQTSKPTIRVFEQETQTEEVKEQGVLDCDDMDNGGFQPHLREQIILTPTTETSIISHICLQVSDSWNIILEKLLRESKMDSKSINAVRDSISKIPDNRKMNAVFERWKQVHGRFDTLMLCDVLRDMYRNDLVIYIQRIVDKSHLHNQILNHTRPY